MSSITSIYSRRFAHWFALTEFSLSLQGYPATRGSLVTIRQSAPRQKGTSSGQMALVSEGNKQDNELFRCSVFSFSIATRLEAKFGVSLKSGMIGGAHKSHLATSIVTTLETCVYASTCNILYFTCKCSFKILRCTYTHLLLLHNLSFHAPGPPLSSFLFFLAFYFLKLN